jgi:hypothetical protein
MTKHIGGNAVKAGFYWNLPKWEMATLSGAGGSLPGTAEDRYLKVPMVAFLFIAPVMGGLYAFFLPFIGFALVLGFLGRKLGAGARDGALHLAGLVSPQWRPGEAYMAGKRTRKADKPADSDKDKDKTAQV